MTKDQLLAEVEDILRAMPPAAEFGRGKDYVFAWEGRAAAVIERWGIAKTPSLQVAVKQLHALGPVNVADGLSALKSLLRQARADLRMEVGQLRPRILIE